MKVAMQGEMNLVEDSFQHGCAVLPLVPPIPIRVVPILIVKPLVSEGCTLAILLGSGIRRVAMLVI